MKRLALLFILAFSISLCAQETGIKFSNDSLLSQALKKSKNEGKLLFIDCYTSWCGPCKYLAKTIFPQKEVGDFYNSHFINLSFDMEKGEGKNIASKYDIKVYPTLLFLNAKGEMVHIGIGSLEANLLIELGKTALDSSKNILSLINKMKSGDKSVETISQYLKAYPFAVDKEELIDNYYKTASDEAKLTPEAWALFKQYVKDFDHAQYQYFLNHRDVYVQKFGKKEVDIQIIDGFNYYINKNRNNPEKAESVKQIDTELYSKCLSQREFMEAQWKFLSNKTDQTNWDNFIRKTKAVIPLEITQPMMINSVCWNIYENFRAFNDLEALKVAKIWQEQALKALPDNHPINDTYAHILFGLGFIKEAIEYEGIAIKGATEQNSTKDLTFYNEAIEIYKKEL